ncbi:MAG: chorion class high-cysteine HCB protein 13 [Lachnospiraceae bacterium]|nr:chorion class high-cysteine HCB protein 13 [Lachnospiraceae bacterium]
MSDLTAANCGCNSCNNTNNNGIMGGNSCIWILLLLFCCGGNNGCGNGILGGNSCGDNNCCDWIIWILLISCFCGNSCN